MPAPKKKQRRSLTNIGGPVDLWGRDKGETSALAWALSTGDSEASREHVHGFHSYPARMHPVTARRLIERLSSPRGLVLDPFCGSGTVLVEARLAGRRAVGIDANPLAVELAWLKTRGTTEKERTDMLDGARQVATFADERRRRKAGATKRYGAEDTSLFEPHVLLELDGLRAGFESIEAAVVRRALALVFSSILVKVSRRPGDTSRDEKPRRLASGFTVRLFFQKAQELATRLARFQSLLPPDALGSPLLRVGDARKMEGVRPASVDIIVTSPPYPGNYDYLQHHAVRLRWLHLDAGPFAEVELGARRHLERLPERAAMARWTSELGAALSAMARVLSPDGKVILILGDSVIGRRPVYADRLVREIAPHAGLDVTAVGSQARPHFHGPSAHAFDRSPRREHAILCHPRSAR
jgi:DNA modification methylase